MAEKNERIVKLKKAKASLKAKLTQFETYLVTASSHEVLSELHANELQARFSRVQTLITDFDTFQTELEYLCDPPEEQYADREKTETKYYQLVAQAQTLLAACADTIGEKRRAGSEVESNISDAKTGGTCNHTHRFHLPKINIPKFDGSNQNWPAVIGCTGSKPEIQKSKSFLVVSNENKLQKPNNFKCPMCKEEHSLDHCAKFRDLTIEKRLENANDLKVCLNCLRSGHSHGKCKFPHCRYCRYKHNTLLHKDDDKPMSSVTNQENVVLATNINEPTTNSDFSADTITLSTDTIQPTTSPHVLLSTALVKVHDNKGGTLTARLLLDNGSTANFITTGLCGKLGLSRRGTSSTVSGIYNQFCKSTQSCYVKIESLNSNYQVEIDCLILPQITKTLPSKLVAMHNIAIPSGIQLADPSFNVPGSVDILVGAEVFWDVICNNSINLGKKQPKLYETKLGWLVSGHVGNTKNKSVHQCNLVNHEDGISKFWELDSIPTKYSLSSEERACENTFKKEIVMKKAAS